MFRIVSSVVQKTGKLKNLPSFATKINASVDGLVGKMPARVPGRMFSVQQSLPRLPVPALEQTLNKFLLASKPVLTPEEFKRAEELTQKLGECFGIIYNYKL